MRELLVTVNRDDAQSLQRQIEDQLRGAIRTGALKRGARMASTRDLARQIGVSRPVVLNAYAQLAAEGYLVTRQGAQPRVSNCVGPERERSASPAPTLSGPLVDFRTNTGDLSSFPRTEWLRSMRAALAAMSHEDLGYGDPRGTVALRQALAEYLGRVRGLVTDPERIMIVGGYAQGRMLLCKAMAAIGVKRVALEDPCQTKLPESVRRAGLTVVPIPVDSDGIRVDALVRSGADAVFLTPAHQFPTGAVMSGERRAAILQWLRDRRALAVEDDYDAEFRYDRAPVGALQSLLPSRIAYAGTASKTLAPALRLGWLVVPPVLMDAIGAAQREVDWGVARIEQHALADFLSRGAFDRHLRRQRGAYRAQRDALLLALRRWIPDAKVLGIKAGLHATVELPRDYDERTIMAEALHRDIGISIMSEYRIMARRPPTLLLGYANVNAPSISVGVRELAGAIAAARRSRRPGRKVEKHRHVE